MISSIKIFRQTEEPEKNINNYLSPFFYDAFLLFTIYKLLISYGNICQRALSQRKAKAKHTNTYKLCIQILMLNDAYFFFKESVLAYMMHD